MCYIFIYSQCQEDFSRITQTDEAFAGFVENYMDFIAINEFNV